MIDNPIVKIRQVNEETDAIELNVVNLITKNHPTSALYQFTRKVNNQELMGIPLIYIAYLFSEIKFLKGKLFKFLQLQFD